MRIAVFGAGAVGSFVGARLSLKNEVVLIGRAAHVRAIRRSGLRIAGFGRRPFRLAATTDPAELVGADLILLTTKSYDTAQAACEIRRARVAAPVVTLQNGLTNLPVLRKTLKGNPLIGGSIVLGVTRLGPGAIRYAGGGRAIVGDAGGASGHAAAFARLMGAAGIPTKRTKDLDAVLWEKAIVNAAVNPVTAVLRCTNGELLNRPEARLVAQLAAAEGSRVARAAGIRVKADAWPVVEQVLQDTRANRSSMLQDVEAGRPTEIDSITGEIVRVARRHSAPVPVNYGLLNLVLSL